MPTKPQDEAPITRRDEVPGREWQEGLPQDVQDSMNQARRGPTPGGYQRSVQSVAVTLHTLIAQNEEVFVSFLPRAGKPRNANLVLTIPNNPRLKVLVPMSRHPVAVTSMLPAHMLRDCMDLFTYVDRGLLKLWDPAEAREYVATHEDARKNIQERIAGLNKKAEGVDESLRVRVQNSSPEDLINPRVLHLVQQLQGWIETEGHDGLGPDSVLVELMEMEEDLRELDIEYVWAYGSYYTVHEWASELLHARKSSLADVQRDAAQRRQGGAGGEPQDDVGSTKFNSRLDDIKRQARMSAGVRTAPGPYSQG